jgi:hypothetical protein
MAEPKIYATETYINGELANTEFVLDEGDPIIGHRKSYPSLQSLATELTKTAFGNYKNLPAATIWAQTDRVSIDRSLTLKELEWLAVNATKPNKTDKTRMTTLV